MDYFMESLVSDLSPNASPVHCVSPTKVKRGQTKTKGRGRPRGPDLVDERSVDIYGDIDVDVVGEETERDGSTQQDTNEEQLSSESRAQNASSSKNKIKETIGEKMSSSSGKALGGTKSSLSSDKRELEMLKERIKELTLFNDKLKSENDKLSANKTQLTKNISCLFLTSRKELQKKEKEIEDLRNTVKELQTAPAESMQFRKRMEDRHGASSRSSEGRSRSPVENTLNSRKHSDNGPVCDRDLKNSRTSRDSRISPPYDRHRERSKDHGYRSTDNRNRLREQGDRLKDDRVRPKEDRTRSKEQVDRSKEDRNRSNEQVDRSKEDRNMSKEDRNRSKEDKKRSKEQVDMSKEDRGRLKEQEDRSKIDRNRSKEDRDRPKEDSDRLKEQADRSKEEDKSKTEDHHIAKCSLERRLEGIVKVNSPPITQRNTNSGGQILSQEQNSRKACVSKVSLDISSCKTISKLDSVNGDPESDKDVTIAKMPCPREMKSISKFTKSSSNEHCSNNVEHTGVKKTETNGDKRIACQSSGIGKMSQSNSQTKTDVSDSSEHVPSNNMVEDILSLNGTQTKDAGVSINSCGKLPNSKASQRLARESDDNGRRVKEGECESMQWDEEVLPAEMRNKRVKSCGKSPKQFEPESCERKAKETANNKSRESVNSLMSGLNEQIDKTSNESCVELLKLKSKSCEIEVKEKTLSVLQKVVDPTLNNPSVSKPKNIQKTQLPTKSSCAKSIADNVTDQNHVENKIPQQSVQETLPPIRILPPNSDVLPNKIPIIPLSSNQSDAIALTSCVVSNQDWASAMSPNASLPFSKMKSPDPHTYKEIPGINTNTSSQLMTNQTWPFENREATNTCGESSISQIEKPVESLLNKGPKSPEPNNSSPIRAFPISDLKDASDLSSCQLSNPSILTKDEDESLSDERLHSTPSASKESTTTTSEEATSSSSGGGEASSKESSTSKSTDTTSSQSQKSLSATAASSSSSSSSASSSSSTSLSSSSNVTIVPRVSKFQSPLKSGFAYEEDGAANLTPPKPKHLNQITPVKIPPTNYDSNTLTPSKSDNILCTPNLIVLGDEETTCATIMSPFKPNSVPSEFIPPGVRKEMKEVNTHFRHIRGKPEFLRSSPASSLSPDVKSKVNTNLLPNDLGFQNNPYGVKKTVNGKGSSEKDGVTISDDEDDDENGEEVGDKDCGGGGGNLTSINDPSLMQPLITRAFHTVFRKDISDFKNEMAMKSCSKTNRKALTSRLKRSARNVRSTSTLVRNQDTTVGDDRPLRQDTREGMDVDQQRRVSGCDIGEPEGKGGNAGKSPDLPRGSVKEHQQNFVNDWVWHSSFNTKPPKRVRSGSKVSKSLSPSNIVSKKESEEKEGGEINNELSFRGKIPSTACEKIDKDQYVSEKLDRNAPVSPTNSCRVTSSSVEFLGQEVKSNSKRQEVSGRKNSHNSHGEEFLNSPEPDSTSDPVVVSQRERRNSHNSEHVKQRYSGDKDKNTESHSPDSPSKHLRHTRSFSKSPRKRVLDFKPPESPCRNTSTSATSCSGDEKGETSQVESDLFLSSSDESSNNSDTDEENENTLNSTFVISKDQSGSECENIAAEPSPKRSPIFSRSKAGNTPIGGREEISLMESNSLSEFDADVASIQQRRQAGITRMSSRTASFSSHVSVGGFSPFAFPSPKLTPSHLRSPKDAMWSPPNKLSESQDSCQEDGTTLASQSSFDGEALASTATPSCDDVDIPQLGKLFSLEEMQQLKMVKTRFGLESSDSDSSSSGGSSSGSGSESETDNCPTPVKRSSSRRSVPSPVKTPMKTVKKSGVGATNVLQSPRVYKLRGEEVRPSPVASSSSCESPMVCRRSPRKKAHGSPQKSVEKITKGNVSLMSDKGTNIPSPIISPRKRTQTENKGRNSGRKNVTNIDCDEGVQRPEHDESCSSVGLRFVQNSPQKSVRIADESGSGEHIVVGTCSSENNSLLKRLCVTDAEQSAKTRKSPAAKYDNCDRSQELGESSNPGRKTGSGRKVGSGRKNDGNVSDRVTKKKELEPEENYGGSPSERRPLSLQEDLNVDPLLMTRRAEFVLNVTKVTRRLDLDKTKIGKGGGAKSDERSDDDDDVYDGDDIDNDGVDDDDENVHDGDDIDDDGGDDNVYDGDDVDDDGGGGDDDDNVYDGDNIDDGNDDEDDRFSTGSQNVFLDQQSDEENVDDDCDQKMKTSSKHHRTPKDKKGHSKDVLVSDESAGKKTNAGNKDDCTNNDGDDNDDDDVEDGEILDEEEDENNVEDCENEREKAGENKKIHQDKSGGRRGSTTTTGNNKGSTESERLHITQDGCKVIPSPKLLARRKGKNFANRKIGGASGGGGSSHGVSPMERVYKPSTSRNDQRRKERLTARQSNSNSNTNKRPRSTPSPAGALEKKRPRVEGNVKDLTITKRDNQSNLSARERWLPEGSSHSHSTRGGNDRRRSPGRRRSPMSSRQDSNSNRQCRSPRRDDRGRSPPRGQSQRSPPPRGQIQRSPPRGQSQRSPPRGQSQRLPVKGQSQRSPPRGQRRRSPLGETGRRCSPRKRTMDERRKLLARSPDRRKRDAQGGFPERGPPRRDSGPSREGRNSRPNVSNSQGDGKGKTGSIKDCLGSNPKEDVGVSVRSRDRRDRWKDDASSERSRSRSIESSSSHRYPHRGDRDRLSSSKDEKMV